MSNLSSQHSWLQGAPARHSPSQDLQLPPSQQWLQAAEGPVLREHSGSSSKRLDKYDVCDSA
eukprot:CAMPEP_0204416388 /NCGR_PEP_ID=MMETSP0470-20130426/25241_1 /ASSEMBLY_ACC=CAM_ASM_000385 /TAXON_ID=2969 /ORGANISM="Oxyrrhis marina" /LENGTH=61 /DNA_ID=CAMNT_0051412861 /DNA_START=199 /DNA_END=384 /DNA_ORIENTATION=+